MHVPVVVPPVHHALADAVPDPQGPARALEFYQKAFGFAQRSAHTGPDGKIQHAEMTYEDAVIMLGPEATCAGQPPTKAPVTTGIPAPVGLYIYCADVDA